MNRERRRNPRPPQITVDDLTRARTLIEQTVPDPADILEALGYTPYVGHVWDPHGRKPVPVQREAW